MLSIACTAFPEYADRIMEGAGYSNDVESNSNMQKQARAAGNIYASKELADGTQVTYQENLDGSAYIILAENAYGYDPTYNITDSATGTGYAYREITIRVSAIGSSQVFYAKQVQFTQTRNGTAHISSTGYLSDSTTEDQWMDSKIEDGTSANPAKIVYRAVFSSSSGPLDPVITLKVDPNNFYITAVPY